MSQELVDKYLADGMSVKQAHALAGLPPPDAVEIDGVHEAGLHDDDTINQLLVDNKKLAVIAINKALTAGKVDNTLVTAAVRALQMYDDLAKNDGDTDPEDDMLAWVAELEKENRERG